MKDIFQILQSKQRQLLDTARDYETLSREVEALKLAARLIADDKQSANGNELTQPEMIREVLKAKGQPMHITLIGKAIQKKYKKKFKSLYLTSIVYRSMKKGKLFVKTKPNTFGLLEWQVRESEKKDTIEQPKVTT